MRRLAIVALAAGALAMPAGAAPLIFSGVITGSLGYSTNPYLYQGVSSGAGYGSIGVTPTLTRQTERSTTTLSGSYYREQYFGRFGNNDSASVTLAHQQQLSPQLSLTAQGGYTTTRNAFLSPNYGGVVAVPTIGTTATAADAAATAASTASAAAAASLLTGQLVPITTSPLVDALTIGQRTRTLSGSAGLNWQASARDTFNASFTATHSTYGGGGQFLAGNYNQYGGSVGYLHALNARTQVGFRVNTSFVHSQVYGNSRSIEPSLSLVQVLSAIWTANADVGVVLQHQDAPFSTNYTGLFFQASVCGKYPLSSICFTGARQSTPSGLGGLRTDLSGSIAYTRKLTELSSLTAVVSYDDSRAVSGAAFLPGLGNQRVFQARADYSRQLTRRLSAGVGARFQNRELAGYGSAHSIGGSVNVSYAVGRIQ